MPLISRNRITTKELFQSIPIHSFFLAISPIISLLAFNIDQIYAQDALIPLIISLSITAMVICVLRILTKNWQLAGLLTSLLLVWFFLYGRIYVPLKTVSVFGLIIGRHRYLFVVWTGIFIVTALWLIKKAKDYHDLTTVLNIFSTILILLPIIQIASFFLRNVSTPKTYAGSSTPPLISWAEDSIPPDIYFIVLDGYVRSDVLQEVYGFDNTPFLEELRQLGFYVAECSRSNYDRTSHSLTTTFNMEYIQNLKPDIAPDEDPAWLLPYYRHNLVRQQLEVLGYKTIVFKNPWERFVWDDADIVYESSSPILLSPFENLLLRTTVARVYLDVLEAETGQLSDYKNYEDTRYALKQLPKVPEIPGPKFVFAHLIIPHSPFVFGPNGEKIDIPYNPDEGTLYKEEDGHRGYRYAVTYINKMMLEIIPTLIHDSETPPIIVIVGDHGTSWGGNLNKVKNLAAFFTPGSESPFYKTVTLVNVFRVLFDEYYNGNFSILPDTSYLFFDPDRRFDFQEFPMECDESD